MSKISFVDSYISQIDEALSGQLDNQAKTSLVKDIVGVFGQHISGIKSGLDCYRARIMYDGTLESQTDGTHDLKLLRDKLCLYREDLTEDEGDNQSSSSERVSVYVDNSASQTVNTNSSSSSSSSVGITISQAIDAVESDPCLSEEQKAELQGLLTQAKGAAAKKDKGAFSRISSKIMDALAAATPGLIMKLLEFLIGQVAGWL